MSSNAIQPTWAPFRSTLSVEERLMFTLRLMNGGYGPDSLISLRYLLLPALGHMPRAQTELSSGLKSSLAEVTCGVAA